MVGRVIGYYCLKSSGPLLDRAYRLSLLGLVGLSLAMLSSPVLAQQGEGSWDAVRQIQGGHTIVVIDMELKSIRGTFSEATEDELRIETDNQPLRIERSNVLRVSRLIRSKQKRNAILGAAVGAGAGAAGGAALAYGVFPDEGGATKPAIAGVAMVASGAVLGALLGRSSGFETVYRATRRT